ncbi:MAG: flavodoxin family protein [Oscillospiraceae bacterium]
MSRASAASTAGSALPGKCFRDDDMAAAIESYVTADLVVWSFPLYYYAPPGQLKRFLDRTVPINRPVMCDRTDGRATGKHVTRYDQSHQRHVLISTCGFFSPRATTTPCSHSLTSCSAWATTRRSFAARAR